MQRGISTFLEGVIEASRSSATEPRADLAGVPTRVARAWRDELLSGYRQDPAKILDPLPAGPERDLVAAKDIEFTSVCRHHLLPFLGKVHIAYVPDRKIAGVSSLGRLVDCLSRRLQLQETLTRQIAEAVQEHLRPEGALCLIEASHTCMTVRGARKVHSRVVTSAYTGLFERQASRRLEAMALLGQSKQESPRQ